MVRRSWLWGLLPVGFLLLACSNSDFLGSTGGGGGGGGNGGGPTLEPAEFNASVNATPPTGYSIAEQSYQWQAYIRYNDAWVAAGSPQTSAAPAAHLVIDCNDPGMHSACTLHLSGMIQVVVTNVSPGPARLCAFKSGFKWYAGVLLYTPTGTLSRAPVAASSQDPANAGICYP